MLNRLNTIFDLQKEAFARDPSSSAEQRIEWLSRIPTMLRRRRKDILDALAADFGGHSQAQGDLLEILSAMERAKFNAENVKRWMKPIKKASNPITQGDSKVYIQYEPKGVIGAMIPWNLPFDIALGATVDALAAGNHIIIKPSQLVPHSGQLLDAMIHETFEEDRVAVVNGGLDLAKVFPMLPWDHLIFTGSSAVGKQVMRAAAENLVPVTLELGGKNPTIVGEDSAEDPLTIATIAGFKVMKRGQMCVAPDYCLVPAGKLDAFVAALSAHMRVHFVDDNARPHACGIIDERHVERLQDLLDDARLKGARIIQIGEGAGREMPFHLVVDPPDDAEMLRYEVFGPILPIMTYQTTADAIGYVNAGEPPLGLYVFSRDRAFIDAIVKGTRSGGVAINTIAMQAGQPSMAFGGIGASGMGRLHGEEAFRELSNPRGFFERGAGGTIDWAVPPYGDMTRYLIDKVAYADLPSQLKFALKMLPRNLLAKFGRQPNSPR